MSTKGLIYVFEGDGKGKTSAALGVSLRMLLAGKKVFWISWFKSRSWKVSEMELTKHFGERLEMHWMGEGFYLKNILDKKVMTGKTLVVDVANEIDHKKAAGQAIELAMEVLSRKETPSLLVLDEVLRAVGDGLISEKELLKVLEMRGKTHLVLTGHESSVKLRRVADLVTKMKKIKHPFDVGVMAVRGLDF